MSGFQTDALNPTFLNAGVLGRRRPASNREGTFDGDTNSISERDKFAADWNIRIDKEIKAVSSGLADLVQMADIGDSPAPHTPAPHALHLRLRTSQLIRATQSLRDTAHELRLMLLLSDEVDTARRRDAEMGQVRKAVVVERRKVGESVKALFTRAEEAEAEAELEINEQPQEAEDEGGKDEDMGGDETRSQEGAEQFRESGQTGVNIDAEKNDEDSDEFEEV